MKLTEQTVSYGRKVQVQKFEPVEVFASRKFELEDGDDPDAVKERIEAEYDELRAFVENQIAERLVESKMDADAEN